MSRRRTRKDWAYFLKELLTGPYAQAEHWQAMRNQSGATVHWQFTTADARIKLERLYPLYKAQR